MKIEQYTDNFLVIEAVAKKRKKVKVECGKKYVYYDVTDNNLYPYNLGTGTYAISLYLQVVGTQYKLIETKYIKVTAENTAATLLSHNQQADWPAKDERFKEIVAATTDAESIKQWFRAHYKYDYRKEMLPVKKIDKTPNASYVLDNNKGLCGDLAILATGVFRAHNIPARYCIGYCGRTYHAWMEYKDNDNWVRYDPAADIQYMRQDKYTLERWY